MSNEGLSEYSCHPRDLFLVTLRIETAKHILHSNTHVWNVVTNFTLTDRKRVFHRDINLFSEGQELLRLISKKPVTCTRSEPTRFVSRRQGKTGYLAYRPASDKYMQRL